MRNSICDIGSRCTGCGLCSDICPAGAIRKRKDENGFCYPEISEDLCAGCGLCLSKCPAAAPKGVTLGEHIRNGHFKGAYAAYRTDYSLRLLSSSGGVFPAIAEAFIKNGGYVCGAVMDDGCMSVKHMISDDPEDIKKMCSSKYIQSDMTGIYTAVRQLLGKGKKVLFSGTPCQAAAVRSFVGEGTGKNLYVIDLFCHGVSSAGYFKKYISEILPGKDLKEVNFRCKDRSWENYGMKIVCGDKSSYYSPYRKDPFLSAFACGYILRGSCYECGAKLFPRRSDITLGDFWMADRINKKDNDHKGLSIVLIETEKGNELMCMAMRSLVIKDLGRETIMDYYQMSGTSVGRPYNADRFTEMMQKKGMSKASKRYAVQPAGKSAAEAFRKILIITGTYDAARSVKKKVAECRATKR